MSVDWFWRRIDGSAVVGGLGPAELAELVPSWHGEDYEELADAGLLVGVEYVGSLVHRLLVLGAPDGPAASGDADPFSGAGMDADEGCAVGVIVPERVRAVAEAFAGADPAAWVVRFRGELAEFAERTGTWFSDDDVGSLISQTRDLLELFRVAAVSGEAIIVRVFA